MAKRLTKGDIEAAKIGARVCASIPANNDAAACFRHLARGNESRAVSARGPKHLVQRMLELATAANTAAARRSR
jgi:hypothetical protein